MLNNVCLNCVEPKRHIGCHDRCQDYQKERKRQDAINESKLDPMRFYRGEIAARYRSIGLRNPHKLG